MCKLKYRTSLCLFCDCTELQEKEKIRQAEKITEASFQTARNVPRCDHLVLRALMVSLTVRSSIQAWEDPYSMLSG